MIYISLSIKVKRNYVGRDVGKNPQVSRAATTSELGVVLPLGRSSPADVVELTFPCFGLIYKLHAFLSCDITMCQKSLSIYSCGM